MIDRLRYRLRALFRQDKLEHEMQDEMRLHLERRTQVLVGRGMTPDQARLAARKEFGNVGVLQGEGRDARGRQCYVASASKYASIRFRMAASGRRPRAALLLSVA